MSLNDARIRPSLNSEVSFQVAESAHKQLWTEQFFQPLKGLYKCRAHDERCKLRVISTLYALSSGAFTVSSEDLSLNRLSCYRQNADRRNCQPGQGEGQTEQANFAGTVSAEPPFNYPSVSFSYNSLVPSYCSALFLIFLSR